MISESQTNMYMALEKHMAVQESKLSGIEKSVDEIRIMLKEQNGRVRDNEKDLTSFKASATTVAFIITILSGSGFLLAWLK